jgi:hypothetical protein
MATDNENFNKDLYDLLKVRGYQPVPLDSKNQRVPASQAADVTQFTFTKDGEEYGKAWISIDDAQNVIVYYDEEQQESPSNTTPGVEYDDSWTGFLKHLKNWSQRRQLSFELANKDRLGDDMRQRDYYKMKEKLGESKQLDELSPDTMKSYKDKAFSDRRAEIKKTLDKTNPANVRDAAMARQGKRARGIFNADKKLGTFKDPNWGKGDDNAWIKRDAQAGLSEARTDHFGYEIKGNAKPWGLYHTRPNKPEKLVSKHHNKNAAEAAKWDQLGMGATVKGEKFTVKKIPEKDPVQEGYYPMGKKASYNDAVPNVKIVLQHNRSLEEGEARYRNVARIYLENVDGERFLAPTNKPGLARVYARHIAEGGLPNDERWNHIKAVCEDYSKMAGFVRATRNGQFNESAQELVQEGINHYNGLRETLHKLSTHRGYQNYFESWTPTLMEDELDESINDLFVQEMVDPRIESAMPILSRLKKPVTEMEEVDSLAEWADGIINEKLELDEAEQPTLKNIQLNAPRFKMWDSNKGPVPFSATLEQGGRPIGTVEIMVDADASPDAWNQEDVNINSISILSNGKEIDPNTINIPYVQIKAELLDVMGDPSEWRPDNSPPRRNDYLYDIEEGASRNFASAVKKSEDSRQRGIKKAARAVNRGQKVEDAIRDHDLFAKDKDAILQHAASLKKGSKLDEMDKEHGSKRDFDNARGPDKTAKPVSVKQFAKGALKSLKRGMKGWEKGMHDVDTVKAATKSLSPDQKEKALAAKAGKGSPAELQQKLIKREKNKKTDENFIGMSPQAVAEEVEEGLDANQKRVGQLGPTGGPAKVGDLVGANESTEHDELARIIDIARFKR